MHQGKTGQEPAVRLPAFYAKPGPRVYRALRNDAAYSFDEVKDLRDKAIAIELYSRQAGNVEAELKWGKLRPGCPTGSSKNVGNHDI